MSSVSLKDQGKEQAKDTARRSSRSKPLRKKKSSSTIASVDTPGSDDVAKELGAKSEKGEGPGGEGEEQEVLSQEDEVAGGGKVPAEVSEDVRKTEDSLAVINRHAEAEDEKVPYMYTYIVHVPYNTVFSISKVMCFLIKYYENSVKVDNTFL